MESKRNAANLGAIELVIEMLRLHFDSIPLQEAGFAVRAGGARAPAAQRGRGGERPLSGGVGLSREALVLWPDWARHARQDN